MNEDIVRETSLDLSVQIFLILREHFFDPYGKPKPFKLRDKMSTQDDPLDEYLYTLLKGKLNCESIKASPLVSPDMVFYDKEALESSMFEERTCEDLSKILALEVKKLNKTSSGSVARKSGLDYNTTPPCGKIRIYTQQDEPFDIRAFYLFVCQEEREKNVQEITSMTLCDGNALNMDFSLYVSTVEKREKEIELGTYTDGLNRHRPMFVFANPLGLSEMLQNSTLIHSAENLNEKTDKLEKVFKLLRSGRDGSHIFWCYRLTDDVPRGHKVGEINDFPTPSGRTKETQSRGRLRLPLDI